jgi:cytidylate kinase
MILANHSDASEGGPTRAPADTSTVLLISRGTMSGAQMIGECLAKHEGFRCVTREHLLAAVNSYGDLATRVTERVAKAVDAYEQFTELRRPYQILMRKALLEYARRGRLAYFGYSGHLLLNKVSHFVRIRLIAPMELRIARTRESLGYSEAEARDYIRRMDQERMHWARLMYGLDIRDPALYDLCLNIERLSMEGACDLLRRVTQQTDYQPTAESVAQVENDYIAAQALALLVTDSRTAHFELGASAADGVLRVVGPYLSEDEAGTVRSIAGSISGVAKVDYEPGYAPAFRYSF